MVELDRTLPEPAALTAYRNAFPNAGPIDWESANFSSAKAAIKKQRNQEQAGLCIYCEQVLPAGWGHVEHIKPKAGPRGTAVLTFVYSNLAHSCDGVVNRVSGKHCGPTKDSDLLTQEPGVGCNNDFELSDLDGSIRPRMDLPGPRKDALAQDLTALGLNHSALMGERKKWLDQVITILKLNDEWGELFVAEIPFRHIMKRLTQ